MSEQIGAKKGVVAVIEPGYSDYRIERELLEPLGVTIERITENEETTLALQRLDPVGILVRDSTLSATDMQACTDLRIVVRYGVGTDNVDTEFARSAGIYVANIPDYGAEIEVSEHALSLYLAVQRRVVTRDREVRQGAWSVGQNAPIPGRDNAVLGLIGCGRIGVHTARKFRALGFGQVLVSDPYVSDDVLHSEGFERVALDQIFAQADVVSLHLPLTPETRNIVNRERIAMMNHSAVLINVSRGGLIDEEALAEALNAGRLHGAGIDVLEQEPPSLDNPLFSVPNIVLSDHCAWYSERSVNKLQALAGQEMHRVLSGGKPANWVNRWEETGENIV